MGPGLEGGAVSAGAACAASVRMLPLIGHRIGRYLPHLGY